MIRISLIIPFFGVERYIRECLESVFQQDLPETEYEVICVNDCSPDKSEEIVLEFQREHANLHLIRHDVNKRLGAARNSGLRMAQGEYVWFIDSDDFIKSECLKDILSYCEKERLEILHWSIQDNQGNWKLKLEDSTVQTGVDDLLNGSRDMTYPWNRVYKRVFLIDNNLWFNDYWGGDVIHTIQALNVAKKVKNVSTCFYFYRIDNLTSDMHSPISANKIISFSFILARALDETIDTLNPALSSFLQECVDWRINQSFKPIVKLNGDERRVFYQTMSSKEDLKSFVLERSDFKVKLVLLLPFVSYILNLFYRTVVLMRTNK